MTTETSLARHWHIAAFPPGINFHAARPDACVYGREIESKLLRRRKSLCSGVGRRVTQFVARRRTSQSHQRQLNTPRSAHRLSCRQRLARVSRLYTLRVIFCRFFSRHHANHINEPRLLMGGATGGVEDIVPLTFGTREQRGYKWKWSSWWLICASALQQTIFWGLPTLFSTSDWISTPLTIIKTYQDTLFLFT